jgi:hypothetical protein
MNPRSLVRLLLETSGHADQNVARLLANNTDDFMDAMRSGQVDNFLRGSNEGRALLNNPEFMRMTTKISGNLDYITRAAGDLAAGRQMNAAEFLTRMDIPATSGSARALTQGIESFNQVAARGANMASGNADAIAAARRTRAPRAPDISADELAARLQRARAGGDDAARASANTADDAVKPAMSSADNAAGAADDVAEGAAGASRMSYFAARRIANGKEPLVSKLELLHRGGRDDMVDRVIARARLNGEINIDVARLARSPTVNIPDAVRDRLTTIAANRADPGFLGINGRIESARAYGDYLRHYPLASAKNAVGSAFSFVRNHPIMTAVGLGGAHVATDGASSRVIGDGVNAAGSAALNTAAGAVSLVSPHAADAAVAVATTGGNLLLDAGRSSTAALATIGGRSVGLDVDAQSGNQITTALGRNPLGRAAIDTANAMTQAGENGTGNLTDRAAGVAGTVADTAQGALDSVSLANALRNPEQAWNKLKEFAATNPTMQRAMEIGEQNPFLKWGLIGGFAMGALGSGTPMERISNGIKQALFLGIMLDLLGGLFGKPSFIMGSLGNMISGRSSTPQPTLTQGMERELGITPTAPAAATSVPATDPGADPLTTIPAATTPAAPANITPVFSAQAQQPAQPDLSANQQAFKSAGQPATPTAPNFSDLHQRQNLVYAPSTM